MKTVISAPLVAANGKTKIGSMFTIEADRKEDVAAFNAKDPFQAANVWAEVRIHLLLMRVDNRD